MEVVSYRHKSQYANISLYTKQISFFEKFIFWFSFGVCFKYRWVLYLDKLLLSLIFDHIFTFLYNYAVGIKETTLWLPFEQ